MASPSSFKLFIAEAEEQENTVSRVVSAIQKRMPKLLGTKIYRFGGKSGVEQTKTGPGYLYFFGDGKAFRVRTKNDAIEAFDVWEKYTLDGPADYTLHTDNLSVAAIAKELKAIAALIKSPKVGKYPIAESNTVSFGTDAELFEAKGVSAEEFLKLAQKDLGDGEVQSVTFDQIVKVARDNNVAVPNKKYLDSQKVGRGRWSLIPGGGSSSGDSDAPAKASGEEVKVDAKDGKPAHTLFIKVTAQDPVTKKFVSAADSKEAQALYKQIAGSMNPNAKPTEEEMRDVDTLYGHLYQLVTMACKNKLRALLIYGGPGTGKTFTIMEAIKEAGLAKGKDYVKVSGKITSTELYKTLFMFRKGGLILFDDCDSMWKDKDSANLLKAALDTSPVREISLSTAAMKNVSKMSDEDREAYNNEVDRFLAGEGEEEEEESDGDGEETAKKGKPDKMKFPSVFDFKGRVVFISNLKKEEFDTAIMSRSAKIDMSLTPEETLKRMRSILPNLGGTDVSLEDKEKLIQVLIDLHGKKIIEAVTMREFIKSIDIIRSGVPNWPDLIQYA